MEILWNQTTRKLWDRHTADAAWQQRWAYGAGWDLVLGRVERAEIRVAGRLAGLAQFTCRRLFGAVHVATCTRGPVWIDPPEEEARSDAYRRLKREIPLPWPRGVFLTPDHGGAEAALLSRARLDRVMSPFSTAFLDLDRPLEDLRAGMQGKWRNRLKAAEKSGIKIAPGATGGPQLTWLMERERAQQRRHRYRAAPGPLMTAWQTESTGRDGLVLLLARQAAETVGAMLFLVHGRTALYHIGWTSEEGRSAGAHNLLLWKAISQLKGRGIRTLDLGGVDTGPGAGIARFKLGTGAQVRTLCGTWC